jgi:hypothetical protein
VLCTIRVPKSGECLIIVVSRWAHCGHHGSLAIAP